jgi:molybdopterin-guanine dinucleotide biosynthesis protein A
MRQGDAVILAGGKSSRMGQDKALLPFGRYGTLAEYQYRKLLPHFNRVWLSAKRDKFPFEAPLLYDIHEIASPLGAIESILTQIDAPEAFVLSVDMPGVDAELIARLRETARARPEAQAIVARSPSGREPLCAIYRRGALPVFAAMLSERNHRINDLLKRIDTVEVPCGRKEVFVNLNTPETYAHVIKEFT